jgi:hypothetical protein
MARNSERNPRPAEAGLQGDLQLEVLVVVSLHFMQKNYHHENKKSIKHENYIIPFRVFVADFSFSLPDNRNLGFASTGLFYIIISFSTESSIFSAAILALSKGSVSILNSDSASWSNSTK